jgi:GT2 family glycosyltransferase
VVRGKFLFAKGEKLYVRGVTYGTFRPDGTGNSFGDPEQAESDLAWMAGQGFNAVRTYTVPPRWFLDVAWGHGLRVMVGLSWEQHVAFLDRPDLKRAIERGIRAGVSACSGHPAVLAYAVGNEVPASIARWHGSRPIERFLERLCEAARAEDPEGLVTYVNYPSTEYLRLPFVDFLCFNLYLESQAAYEAYLARLHNLAGNRPLVIAEAGLDSRRHGEAVQARTLSWQVRQAFASGAAGAFVFAWTDEWHRGGQEVEDWDFGLTTRRREPKLALPAVSAAFSEVPFPHQTCWPRASVVVCTYNGGRTLRPCLDGLARLDYPNYEVIVVDDGSTDDSAAIASEFDCRLISTENRGLSSARNTGWAAATGEIVAYLDDDAYPDPHWLKYLAAGFNSSNHCGIGGPNVPPPDENFVAQCVAQAPGGPTHVLLTDAVAEHIPGCNMAFRRSRLRAIGGFDAQFRVAGDDVDVCWRLQERGWTIGFCPAALVWHRRRSSLGAFWKQQKYYGVAESLLRRKWPSKYNLVGHVVWAGRLYGSGYSGVFGLGDRIYHGAWGMAPFQGLHPAGGGILPHLPAMPEWILVLMLLAFLSGLGLLWTKLLWAVPVLALALGITVYQSAVGAAQATIRSSRSSRWHALGQRGFTMLLYLLQPAARLTGRVCGWPAAVRRLLRGRLAIPVPRSEALWSEEWRAPEERLRSLESSLRTQGGLLRRGGAYDAWDLELRAGVFGAARLCMAVEEHGAGRQMFRFRLYPRCTTIASAAVWLTALLALGAAADGAWGVTGILGAISALVGGWSLFECGWGLGALREAVLREEGTLHNARTPRTMLAASAAADPESPSRHSPAGVRSSDRLSLCGASSHQPSSS